MKEIEEEDLINYKLAKLEEQLLKLQPLQKIEIAEIAVKKEQDQQIAEGEPLLQQIK